MVDEQIEKLKKKFTPSIFSFDPELLKVYGKDWTNHHPPNPLAVAFPRSTQEVSEILRFCSEDLIAVVPSGGRTGLSGGAVAAKGELVLSLEKMNRIEAPCPTSKTLKVQAGAIVAQVNEVASQVGLQWPIRFGAEGSAHIGGVLSTNAGGVHVIRYGSTRNWVLGLTAVLMDGTIVDMNTCLEKNNTGIDLKQLFIGSEGILGVITEASLKLTPLDENLKTLFLGVNGMKSVIKLLNRTVLEPSIEISAFEVLTQNCLRLVEKNTSIRSPLSSHSTHFVLLETNTPDHLENSLLKWLEDQINSGLIEDSTLSQSSSEYRNLWALRENISESLATEGIVHKHDISVPVASLPDFLDELETLCPSIYSNCQLFYFGHVGDGNLHLNILKPQDLEKDKFFDLCREASTDVFKLIQKYRGSISAEHGIGLLKKPFLSYTRSNQEIDSMKKIKEVFDPKGLMNPGKVL